jgi:sulfur carrier protein
MRAMIEITVNGERQTMAPGATAADLLAALSMTGRRIAVEVNEELLPRSRFEAYRLQPGDRIEIVHAIGGG